MAESYDMAVREEAEELYVLDGHTYEETARLTGVSVSQLKRWGKRGGWTESRREYRSSLGVLKRKTVQLRRELLEKALGSKNPQNVYAFATLERAVKPKETAKKDELLPVPVHSFKDLGEAIEALQQAIFQRFGELVHGNGSINPRAIGDLKTAMAMVDEMKAKYTPEKETGDDLLDDEEIDDIMERLRM